MVKNLWVKNSNINNKNSKNDFIVWYKYILKNRITKKSKKTG